MPGAHGFGNAAITNEHRVDSWPEEPLDQCCRGRIGADEITERAQNSAFAENSSLFQQPCGGRSKPDALPLQTFQRV